MDTKLYHLLDEYLLVALGASFYYQINFDIFITKHHNFGIWKWFSHHMLDLSDLINRATGSPKEWSCWWKTAGANFNPYGSALNMPKAVSIIMWSPSWVFDFLMGTSHSWRIRVFCLAGLEPFLTFQFTTGWSNKLINLFKSVQNEIWVNFSLIFSILKHSGSPDTRDEKGHLTLWNNISTWYLTLV